MEKRKVLVSFVEKASNQKSESPVRGRLIALTSDGKRLVRLQPAPAPKCQLIGVLTERNGRGVEEEAPTSRQPVRIEPKPIGLQLRLAEEEVAESGCADGAPSKRRIPRPANAFMLFANEWRKKLAVENPRESNKDISVRLGVLWKTMAKDVKEKYFALAREVDAEHKRKYPDYVYNPKEARLRKAMREQSRELSRSSGANGLLGSGAALRTPGPPHQQQQQQPPPPPTPHQQQQQQAGMSPLPGGGPPIAGANRIIGPWFPLSHAAAPPQPPAAHPKPILSPRVMASHQRTLDKTKDVIRKQLECGAGYPTGYSGEYGPRGSPEYCDFADGQKWHPYQNGVSAYHSRSALMSKMNSLHRGVQGAASHAASPWGQFCNVPFPTSQSAMMRSNRHMVFLQEQQSQHCGYPDEMQMSYEAKMQEDLARRLRASYSQEDQQAKSPLRELQLSQHLGQEEAKSPEGGQDEAPRWGTPRPSSVSSSSCTTDTLLEREAESVAAAAAAACRLQPAARASKQPLPGFQQAFGSTEIGKFSRSELFASLVEAANLIPSDGVLKSYTVFPRDTPAESLNFAKAEELRKRVKAGECFWIETIEFPGPKKTVPTALDKSRVETKPDEPKEVARAQKWPSPSKHSESECSLPASSLAVKRAAQSDECLDLRVPWRKRPKESLETSYPDSSVDSQPNA